MSKANDGGAAFSRPVSECDSYRAEEFAGLTKREYFAAAFGAAELASSGAHAAPAKALAQAADRAGRTVEAQIAHNAVRLADALLAALADPTPPHARESK